MLTVHMPFLRNVAALLKICFKNLEGIITSENIMKINLLAYGWFMLDENSNSIHQLSYKVCPSCYYFLGIRENSD